MFTPSFVAMCDATGAFDEESAQKLMVSSFDLLLWRGMLEYGPVIPSGQEIGEWAGCLRDAGEETAAALLSDVAALHQGFSPQAVVARQGGRFPSVPRPDRSGILLGGSTLHRALTELQDLARMAAAAALPRLVLPRMPQPSGRPDNPAGIGITTVPAAMNDIAAVARDLRAELEAEAADVDRLEGLLECANEAGRRFPSLDYRRFAQAPLPVLAAAIATIGLSDFAMSTRDLWKAPTGSPALLHLSARFHSHALGPYLGNINRIASRSRDVIDLARTACNTAAEEGDDAAKPIAWLVLLSRGCRNGLLCEIVDDLGDFAEHDALLALLTRTASRPDKAIDTRMVCRVRDAGLDNGDYALAAKAQRIIVRLQPDSQLEAVILGTIEASSGEFARAEAIFRQWLKRRPNDEELLNRLLAVRKDQIDQHVILHGFGSPADRRDFRLRRRGIAPEYHLRRGKRIRAVDVG